MPCSSARRAAAHGPADRAPAALDEHLRPRQPEPALLAHGHLAGADAPQQVALVDRRKPLPRHRLGLATRHAATPRTRSRSSAYL